MSSKATDIQSTVTSIKNGSISTRWLHKKKEDLCKSNWVRWIQQDWMHWLCSIRFNVTTSILSHGFLLAFFSAAPTYRALIGMKRKMCRNECKHSNDLLYCIFLFTIFYESPLSSFGPSRVFYGRFFLWHFKMQQQILRCIFRPSTNFISAAIKFATHFASFNTFATDCFFFRERFYAFNNVIKA